MHQYQLITKGAALPQARKALLLFHGRGASAEDILSLGNLLAEDDWHLVAPQASNRTWYPLSFMAPKAQNEPWLSSALEVGKRLLDEVLGFLPAEQIYIAGFSQGACLSSELSARHAMRFGGVGIFTGGLIGASLDTVPYQGSFGGTPVYMSNSDEDPHVPLSRSQETEAQLRIQKAQVRLEVFPKRPHLVLPEEIQAAKAHWGLV